MSKLNLSNERYILALKRIRVLIVEGLPLSGYDDTTIGSKNTECTWGLCAETKQHWPDPVDYLWPDQPDRIAHKYTTDKQKCPMDMRNASQLDGNGCFWSCRFFQKKKNRVKLTKENVVALYDAQINVAEGWKK